MRIAYMDEAPGKNIASFLTKKELLMKVEHVLHFKCDEEVVVASPHKSKDEKPAITIHYPGNACDALFGGEERTLNTTNPFLAYRLYVETLSALENIGEAGLLTYEADHHGPTIKAPILFYEIGATEEMWNDESYAKLMAECLERALKSEEKPSQIFLAVGGNHYASKFNELTRRKGFAYTHILAKHHIDCMDEVVFKQALEKSLGKPEAVLVDKKGTNLKQKDVLKEWCERAAIDLVLV